MKTRRTEEYATAALFGVAVLAFLLHLGQDETRSALLSGTASIAAGLTWLHIRGGSTRMSKPNKRRFKLSEVRTQQAQKRGGSTIDFETDNGDTFSIPAPGFWTDDQAALIGNADTVKLATALLGGEDNYARFKAAGGQSQDISLVMAAYADAQGANSEGESSASSAS